MEKERTDALEMAEKAHEERQEKESPESRQEIELVLYNCTNCEEAP